MNKKIVNFMGFIIILYIYVTLLIALAPVVPIIFLTGLLVWIVVRRPITHPERIDADIKMFAKKVGEIAGKIFETLVMPFTDSF